MLARLFPPRDGASLHALVRAAVGTGAVPPDLLEYLEATLSLPELTLRDVMVPRVDVVAVSENCSAREAARQMAACGHTRAPVYRDSPDRPIGILHALDLLRELATRTTSSRGLPRAGKLARPALSLPDTLSVLEAVRAMRSQAAHIALVVDERGGLAGLVTLEDLLEQFVGPVPDEYSDDSRAAIRRIDKGIAVVGATARLHQLERVLGVRFPKTRFTTIGGLVYDHLRRVPKPGDVVQLPGICIEVLSVDGPRLRDLRIQTTIATTHRAAFVELGIGKEVICGGDVVGQVERLIADPGSPRVRQVVVRRGNRSVVIPLEVIDIPDPCPVDWNDMRGDERVRFCRHCALHVYNLSAMTRDAAERLVAEREWRGDAPRCPHLERVAPSARRGDSPQLGTLHHPGTYRACSKPR